jgi:hypothetical protein
MRINLSKFILAPVVMAAAALASNTAMAETIKVPFNFTVAGQNWPAGEYSIIPLASGNQISLVSQDGKKIFTSNLGPGAPDPGDRLVALRFDEVGDSHALKTVQYKSMITSDLNKKSRHSIYASSRLSQGR